MDGLNAVATVAFFALCWMGLIVHFAYTCGRDRGHQEGFAEGMEFESRVRDRVEQLEAEEEDEDLANV